MNTPNFPGPFSGKPSDALAIVNKGIILYANDAFEKLYNCLDSAAKGKLSQELADLDMHVRNSGEAFAPKRMALTLDDSKIDALVYLLNKSESDENHFLLLADTNLSPGDVPNTTPDRSQDSGQLLKKSTPKKLLPAFSELIGEDIHFKAVLFAAQKAAQSDYPVLISGESGTGKEILARTIHRTSRRSRKKFVDINCAAIPDQLIDSELFGYEKGAFTGATPGGKHGLFFEAHQGTLFFDEVADASLQTQAKLLRVLNEGYFKRIGGTKNIEVDVRIISATNKELSIRIKEQRFRNDLFYRLNTIRLHLPPLRERPNDIVLLANFFLKYHIKHQKRVLEFSDDCLDGLRTYQWPGNVRELKGVIDYSVTMATGSLITANDFPEFLLSKENRNRDTSESRSHPFEGSQEFGLLSNALQHTEKEVIKGVLQQAKNRSEAIKILGISRRTFYTKLKQYDLD